MLSLFSTLIFLILGCVKCVVYSLEHTSDFSVYKKYTLTTLPYRYLKTKLWLLGNNVYRLSKQIYVKRNNLKTASNSLSRTESMHFPFSALAVHFLGLFAVLPFFFLLYTVLAERLGQAMSKQSGPFQTTVKCFPGSSAFIFNWFLPCAIV